MYTPEVWHVVPEKWWLEDYFPLGCYLFRGYVKLPGVHRDISLPGHFSSFNIAECRRAPISCFKSVMSASCRCDRYFVKIDWKWLKSLTTNMMFILIYNIWIFFMFIEIYHICNFYAKNAWGINIAHRNVGGGILGFSLAQVNQQVKLEPFTTTKWCRSDQI